MHVLVNALTELSGFAALSFHVGVLHEYGADFAQVLRVHIRAVSAVEPTRSENITVTWRRSAVSWAFGLVNAGCGDARPHPKAPGSREASLACRRVRRRGL